MRSSVNLWSKQIPGNEFRDLLASSSFSGGLIHRTAVGRDAIRLYACIRYTSIRYAWSWVGHPRLKDVDVENMWYVGMVSQGGEEEEEEEDFIQNRTRVWRHS